MQPVVILGKINCCTAEVGGFLEVEGGCPALYHRQADALGQGAELGGVQHISQANPMKILARPAYLLLDRRTHEALFPIPHQLQSEASSSNSYQLKKCAPRYDSAAAANRLLTERRPQRPAGQMKQPGMMVMMTMMIMMIIIRHPEVPSPALQPAMKTHSPSRRPALRQCRRRRRVARRPALRPARRTALRPCHVSPSCAPRRGLATIIIITTIVINHPSS